jgi:hypothetical protein
MIVHICAGNWPNAPSHAPIVLRVLRDVSEPEDAPERISHGCCPACVAAMNAAIDKLGNNILD